MRFPWSKKPAEQRASYTDAAIGYIVAQASGADVQLNPNNTAAGAVAASLLGRSLASATITPPLAAGAFTPSMRYELGCALVLEGEGVYLIDVVTAGDVARIELRRASDWEVRDAGADWRYSLTIPGPTEQTTVNVPGAQVFHPRINVSKNEPHRGNGMIAMAGFTGKVLAATEWTLANEMSAPSGYVMPAPVSSLQDSDLEKLKEDLRALRGRTSMVPSMSTGWGEGRSGAPSDWQPNRLGGDPPDSLVKLREAAHSEVLASAGVPPNLFGIGNAEGKREALRQYIHTTVDPIADLIAFEARAKLDIDIKFGFAALHASDVQGRARAFQSLVASGMDIEKAATLSGLLIQESED